MNFTFSYNPKQVNPSIFGLEGDITSVDDTLGINLIIDKLIVDKNLYHIFDLKDLNYINSTGLNFIITSFTKLRNAGGELLICNVSKKVENLLVITKLNTIFATFDSVEEAKECIKDKTIT